ncbi:hypothetical protein D3C85_1098080 [compost metagenome]
MHQRAALGTGEHRGVEFLLDFRIGAGQDQAATRAAQGLVGGAGDHVGERQRVGVQTGGDQAGDVGHVDEQQGADLVGDGAEAGEIQGARIGAEPGDYHLRLVFDGQALDFGVVDQAILIDAVLHGVVQLARGRHLGAVGQVAAVGQAHAEDGIAGIDQRQVHGRVGRGTGVRLDVGVVGAEQLLGPIYCKLLDHVDMLATAVVALARIAFGVLVGQAAALGLHDPFACVVFRGDQLDVIFLALLFGVDRGEQGVIVALQLVVLAEHAEDPRLLFLSGATGPPRIGVSRNSWVNKAVGWVERSDTHHPMHRVHN